MLIIYNGHLFFSERTGSEIGFGKEILDICLEQTTYQAQYKTLPIKRTHVYMQTGEIDISVYSYKAERNDSLYYASEVLFSSAYVLASKKDNKLKINSFTDLEPLVIGHLPGLAHTPELLKIIEQKNFLIKLPRGKVLKPCLASYWQPRSALMSCQIQKKPCFGTPSNLEY
ncbi:hypothetical protein SAMN05216262_101161 [Colwellia chukchiensis]|uniref:Uncharacterized protein n=1 Tax=Colwellia chukchiensis TaxID=641665 RepID=A0A1H7GDP2_9GAMM|nr:hypothetical protein [Colwellia chukchiensis]SEK36154.1 hypothetical protein SAMN05216262_101161 [Colwellia chukchiensis]